MEGKQYDTEIEDVEQLLEQNSTSKQQQENKCRKYSGAVEKTENSIAEIERKIESIPAEIINIVEVKEEQISKQKQIELTNQISRVNG